MGQSWVLLRALSGSTWIVLKYDWIVLGYDEKVLVFCLDRAWVLLGLCVGPAWIVLGLGMDRFWNSLVRA